MNIHIYLPPDYPHDHFTLKFSGGNELSLEDQATLDTILRRTRRTAQRLAKIDAQN